MRIIPAYAGQIIFHQLGNSGGQDHPRIRGTNLFPLTDLTLLSGSSPHTRDKFYYPREKTLRPGIIPAYAGQIFFISVIVNRPRDHPRIRGTNARRVRIYWWSKGSSPHTRDKCCYFRQRCVPWRIIPAYAGQMESRQSLLSLFRDHPRIRGTNFENLSVLFLVIGSSPHTRDKLTTNIIKSG